MALESFRRLFPRRMARRPRSEMNDPATDPGTWLPLNIDLRRAVLGVLIQRGGEPVSLSEICTQLIEVDRIDLRPTSPTSTPAKRVSDVLRWQTRRGRVVRVKRGSYRFVPGSVSASMKWRCLHWRQLAEQRRFR